MPVTDGRTATSSECSPVPWLSPSDQERWQAIAAEAFALPQPHGTHSSERPLGSSLVAPTLVRRLVTLHSVTDGTRLFVLRHPIRPVLELGDDGCWALVADEFYIYSGGRTIAEALAVFGGDFAAQWDEIAKEDVGSLDPTAVRVREGLLRVVQEVRA
jgi:hypothetical protein